jgi:hypothetical protein
MFVQMYSYEMSPLTQRPSAKRIMAPTSATSDENGPTIPVHLSATNGEDVLRATGCSGLSSIQASRDDVLGRRVVAPTHEAHDWSHQPLEFPIDPARSPTYYGGYVSTHNTILQKYATHSMTDRPYASPQMTPDTNMSVSGLIEGSIIQPRLLELDPETGLATQPAFSGFSLICKWEGCKYAHSFGREAELLRHVKTVHLSPSAFFCPELGCSKSCSRKDNCWKH